MKALKIVAVLALALVSSSASAGVMLGDARPTLVRGSLPATGVVPTVKIIR